MKDYSIYSTPCPDTFLGCIFLRCTVETIRYGTMCFILFFGISTVPGNAQSIESQAITTDQIITIDPDFTVTRDTVPDPRVVMRRSMIVPGWGQVTNKQTWKVPVIYGMLAGVVAYTYYAHDRYQGYRAAYYNSFAENTDLRFGPTPAYIPTDLPPELYRANRNQFRNYRDTSVIVFFLVYGLNIADAYIFAHLRDFDVSDDLSATFQVVPEYLAGTTYPTMKLTIRF